MMQHFDMRPVGCPLNTYVFITALTIIFFIAWLTGKTVMARRSWQDGDKTEFLITYIYTGMKLIKLGFVYNVFTVTLPDIYGMDVALYSYDGLVLIRMVITGVFYVSQETLILRSSFRELMRRYMYGEDSVDIERYPLINNYFKNIDPRKLIDETTPKYRKERVTTLQPSNVLSLKYKKHDYDVLIYVVRSGELGIECISSGTLYKTSWKYDPNISVEAVIDLMQHLDVRPVGYRG